MRNAENIQETFFQEAADLTSLDFFGTELSPIMSVVSTIGCSLECGQIPLS